MSIPSLKSPEDLRRLRLELLGVSVYRKVLVQPVSAALLKLMEAAVGEDPAKLCESWGALCSTLDRAAGQPSRRRGRGGAAGR